MEKENNLKKAFLAKKGVISLASVGILLSFVSIAYAVKESQRPAEEAKPAPQAKVVTNSVASLGRLEPKTEVIKLAPPPTMGGAKIAELLVKEGDLVAKNQVIAVLDDYALKQAASDRASAEIRVAQANLDIVKAGAKTGEKQAQRETISRYEAQLQGEIQSQNATIERLKAELKNAESEYQRYAKLAKDGAISASELDQRSLARETAQKRLSEAQANLTTTINTLNKQIREEKANLDRIAEVRDVDVQQAIAQLEKAQAEYKQAQAELELTRVRSPIEARVLKINARVGEAVSQENGILELGETEQMMVVAEIYESDIGKIKLGQNATIVSESRAFAGQLSGKVTEVGWQIGKKDVLNTDPAADVDSRVVEVKILLNPEDSRRVAQLTYSKVLVEIKL